MTDSDETVLEVLSLGTDLNDLSPEAVPTGGRSAKSAARRASKGRAVVLPEISLAALLHGDPEPVKLVSSALESTGFYDGLPDGDTFLKAYARLQRYLGGGPTVTGVPDSDSLTWLALRTQMFTTTD